MIDFNQKIKIFNPKQEKGMLLSPNFMK